ncbi:hypothetical protein DSM104299_03453 [Baekduia alba]|uniref:DUF1365 domain-containing protein n=1 Tax=Baekduia alba TaxID=2997333 RepID=UPI0023422AC0|nr:DUF1365 domain-containing protein [Baekduia alba]WCB94714.1 hypothetical protein DSM104299_03453 [Baekduia alba]
MIAPALYVGTVRHRRFAVREHAFRHKLALAYVDLERLPARAGRLVRFDPDDYLSPLRVRALTGGDGPIGLLTQPRSLGKAFNPVSFYYAYDRDATLHAVVAEVTSTPYGQRHAYVLQAQAGERVHRAEDMAKQLHVSPFMGMDQHYSWSTTQPDERLSVHIESRDDGAGRAFDATLSLRRTPFSRTRLLGGSLRTLTLIYAHAFALALKRVPIHARPEEARP